MTDGMVQVQMLVPALKTDATLTATMSKIGGLMLEIKSDVKLPESSSVQAVTFKYGTSCGFQTLLILSMFNKCMFKSSIICISGENQAEVQLMSNMNANTMVLNFYGETFVEWLMILAHDAMDQKVVSTDLKLRHIINKAVEVMGTRI